MNTLDRFVVKRRKPDAAETEGDNCAVDSLVSNVSGTCVVCCVISETVTNNSSVEDCVRQTFRTYWYEEQRLQKLNENEWHMIQNGKCGLKTCREVESQGIHNTQGLTLSTEWKECYVSSFEMNYERRRQSIGKKIFYHKISAAYQTCFSIKTK